MARNPCKHYSRTCNRNTTQQMDSRGQQGAPDKAVDTYQLSLPLHVLKSCLRAAAAGGRGSAAEIASALASRRVNLPASVEPVRDARARLMWRTPQRAKLQQQLSGELRALCASPPLARLTWRSFFHTRSQASRYGAPAAEPAPAVRASMHVQRHGDKNRKRERAAAAEHLLVQTAAVRPRAAETARCSA